MNKFFISYRFDTIHPSLSEIKKNDITHLFAIIAFIPKAIICKNIWQVFWLIPVLRPSRRI